MGGSGATTGSQSSSTNQEGSYSQGPADWMNKLAQAFGSGGANTFGQSNNLAGQIQGNSANMVGQGNQMVGAGGNMIQGGYNQAQNAAQYNNDTFQNQFMNPYTKNVVEQNANIAQRDFNQQTAPSLMGQYGASGQFGSGRADMGLALAQTQNQQNVNQINAGLMNQGYNQSQQNYLNSMGIGVNAGGVMAGAGTGMANAGQTAYNQGMGQLLGPGQVFDQYAGGLSKLPYGTSGTQSSQTNQAGATNAPQQGLF